MEPKAIYKTFWYETEVRWESNRKGQVSSMGMPGITISSPPEFKGEAGIWTPEHLFVTSVNACTMTTFLAYAQHRNLPLVSYESDAKGMAERIDGKYRFTKIELYPHIEVHSQEAVLQARQILDNAHRDCMISNSTNVEVKIVPRIQITGAAAVDSATE